MPVIYNTQSQWQYKEEKTSAKTKFLSSSIVAEVCIGFRETAMMKSFAKIGNNFDV